MDDRFHMKILYLIDSFLPKQKTSHFPRIDIVVTRVYVFCKRFATTSLVTTTTTTTTGHGSLTAKEKADMDNGGFGDKAHSQLFTLKTYTLYFSMLSSRFLPEKKKKERENVSRPRKFA